MDLLRGAAIIVVLCNFSAASGNEWHKMCFFHLLFLVQHKFGANHYHQYNKPPDDDSPAYYEGTRGLRREESIQPYLLPLLHVHDRIVAAQCTTPTPACWRWTVSSVHTTVQKLSYLIFAASAVPVIPINPLSQLFFNLVRHRSFFRAHISRGKGSLRTTE
jgi:hypothetical protein